MGAQRGKRHNRNESGNYPLASPDSRAHRSNMTWPSSAQGCGGHGTLEKRMSAAVAFMMHLAKRGLEADGAAGRALMTAIEDASGQKAVAGSMATAIAMNMVAPGSVNTALEPLRIARKFDPHWPTARMML